jgi:EAL domain-containing protein (putative c-di-GMP-specific phosphodiesterase class I)/GGDEF domain-containing protein
MVAVHTVERRQGPRWMQIAPIPPTEGQRLAELRSYGVLDTPREQAFDDISELTRAIAGTPVAIVSLVDENRQWFKSCLGLDAEGTPRDVSFCSHTILQRIPLIIPDALEDARFSDNPLVLGEPHIRFYAGFPLIAGNGMVIGSLCAVDFKPGRLNDDQITLLQRLARQVVRQLELTRAMARLTGVPEPPVSEPLSASPVDPASSLSPRFLSRDAFVHLLDVMLALPVPPSFSVLNVKLCELSRIHAALGQAMSERVFQAWSASLEDLLPENASCSRSSPSEVLILLPHLQQRETIQDIAERLIRASEGGQRLDDATYSLPLAIGVATSLGNYQNFAALEADTRIAQQAARRSQRSAVRFIDLITRISAMRELSLEADLRKAIPALQLQPWPQPIVNLADGRWCGMEMLVRWPQPHGTPILPKDFLPAAERAGLLAEIDLLVLQQSLKLLNRDQPWPGTGVLSVNLSAALLNQSSQRRQWLNTLEQFPPPPGWIVQAELIEEALQLDLSAIEGFLGTLVEMGVRLAIDDFGTGYSSLSRLHHFPIQTIKVDQGYIARIGAAKDPSDRLLSTIHSIATMMEMDLTAEGIETEAQARWLAENGFQKGQGYLYGRPMPWEEFLGAAQGRHG